jgi:hypothetical protein
MARKKMPWFRFYAETVSDRKIRRLKIEHRWLWVTVLCAVRQSPVEGVLMLSDDEPFGEDDLADLGALPVRAVRAGLTELERSGLIERVASGPWFGAWSVVKWSERQSKSDTSTDRVRAHRARSKEAEGTADETFHDRSRNGHGNAPEVEVEVEEETDVTNPPTPLSKGGSRSSAGHIPWNGDAPATQGPGEYVAEPDGGFTFRSAAH